MPENTIDKDELIRQLMVSHRSTPSAKHLHYRDAIVFRSSQ